MTPIEHIRINILKVTQTEFAQIVGVEQGTVSRWENGQLEPRRDQLEAIRKWARKRRLQWSDSWFFEKARA